MSTPADPSEHVLLRRNMESPLEIPCAGGRAVVFTHGRPGEQAANEDAAALVSLGRGRGILAVADGAGGHASGADASEAALLGLLATASDLGDDDALRPWILDGIERAGRAVADVGSGAATTLAVLEIDAGTVRPYHVGDSEILVCGQRGRIRLQIVPHSPTGYAVEAGLLDAEAAIAHSERHFVSNVVGAADMRIEIGPTVTLHPLDTVLLATDGLFDNLHTEEIVEIVRKGPLTQAASGLAGRAGERMGAPAGGDPCKPDDLTFVLWRQGAAPATRQSGTP